MNPRCLAALADPRLNSPASDLAAVQLQTAKTPDTPCRHGRRSAPRSCCDASPWTLRRVSASERREEIVAVAVMIVPSRLNSMTA
mgnify:CR=1 FL=1